MATPRHDLSQLKAEVHAGSVSVETVQYRGNKVPRSFVVLLSHPKWPAPAELQVTVDTDGPVPTGLVLGRGSSRLVPYTALHEQFVRTVDSKAMHAFLRWATAQAVAWHMADEFLEIRHTEGATPVPPDEAKQRIESAVGAVWDSVSPRRRRIVTPDHLIQVAEIYRDAMKEGRAPTAAVADHFTVSHSTAARWVREARQQQYLGPAQGPKPGEAQS